MTIKSVNPFGAEQPLDSNGPLGQPAPVQPQQDSDHLSGRALVRFPERKNARSSMLFRLCHKAQDISNLVSRFIHKHPRDYSYSGLTLMLDLTKAKLDGIDFSRSSVSGNFNRASLTNANFKDTVFGLAYLRGANLSGAQLIRTDMSKVLLSNMNSTWGDVIFDKAVFDTATLPEGDIYGISCKGTKFKNVRFNNKFYDAFFQNAEFEHCSFGPAQIDFSRCDFRNTKFRNCDFSEVGARFFEDFDFEGVTMDQASYKTIPTLYKDTVLKDKFTVVSNQ